MRSILPLLAVVAMVSCRTLDHTAISDGNYHYEHDIAKTLGGTTHFTGADGASDTTDHNASFQVGAQTVGVIGTGIIGLLTTKATELTKQLANAQAGSTERAQIAANLQTTLKQLDAQLVAQGLSNQATHFQTAVAAGLFTPVPLPTR